MSDQTTIYYDLPDDIVENLLCSHCLAYVSCGPVKQRSDGTFICGRCSETNDEDCHPQVLFEVAMARFTFPCRYKQQGCKKRVLFDEAVEHEHECPYRTVCCPTLPYNSCLKYVSAFDVYDHFKEAHADFILKDGKFKLEFEQDVQCNLLIAEDNVIVVVQYIYDSIKKILYLDVKHFLQGGKKDVYYKLQIISGCDSDNTVNLKERQCDPYVSHTLNVQNAGNLLMDNYLPVLENPNFIYVSLKLTVNVKCSIANNFSSVILASVNEYEEAALAAWNALENIRCVRCYSFAIPPIFLNQFKEPICHECKNNQVQKGVERKIEIKNYPCRWRGCTFMGNHSNIKEHVESCQFQTFMCPVLPLCEKGYFTLNNLMEHMQRHGTFCPNPEKVVIDLFYVSSNDRESKVYFTVSENRVIAFTCDISNNYNWRLSGSNENIKIVLYFEHDHCRFISKTYTYSGKINICFQNYKSFFPKCFYRFRRISAVLKITNNKKLN